MLSICIPTYNYQVASLIQALHSCAQKCSFPIEILIQDDASSQEYGVLEETLGIKISYERNPNNLGRTATRALLAERAVYDWLLFLDADTKPVTSDFLSNFEPYFESKYDLVCGGISYAYPKPQKELLLRWKFGKEREARPAAIRQQTPYHVVSGNLCIRKNIFAKANPKEENNYGLDNIFSNRLRESKACILHIENPVYHLGLETNAQFLDKSFKAIETLVALEKSGDVQHDQSRLQQAYLKLKSSKMELLFYKSMQPLLSRFRKKLVAGSINLRSFDILRLHHYIQLKRHG